MINLDMIFHVMVSVYRLVIPAEFRNGLSSINPSVLHCAQSGWNFFAARFFLEAVGEKWGRQQREQPLESKLK